MGTRESTGDSVWECAMARTLLEVQKRAFGGCLQWVGGVRQLQEVQVRLDQAELSTPSSLQCLSLLLAFTPTYH